MLISIPQWSLTLDSDFCAKVLNSDKRLFIINQLQMQLSSNTPELRVGNCYLEVLPGRTGVVAWVLPRVLPGVTWCYLECYLVLPGRCLALPGFIFWSSFFLWSQNIRVSQTQTFGKRSIST